MAGSFLAGAATVLAVLVGWALHAEAWGRILREWHLYKERRFFLELRARSVGVPWEHVYERSMSQQGSVKPPEEDDGEGPPPGADGNGHIH